MIRTIWSRDLNKNTHFTFSKGGTVHYSNWRIIPFFLIVFSFNYPQHSKFEQTAQTLQSGRVHALLTDNAFNKPAGTLNVRASEPAPFAQGHSGGEYGFTFVRVRYADNGYRGRWGGRGMWATDWPTADLNLHTALERTTEFRILGEPIVLSLKDKRIFEYPVLYLTEPGYWLTDDAEVKSLREYLDRGGFIIIDDFHEGEWYNMYSNMKRVFPEKEPVELLPDHPIWTIYYDIDPVEAPSTKGGRFGRYNDRYYAIYDDNGRMMVVISYNQDIGDGWEWPNRLNIAEASTVSFQMAINFIIYALTH
ncbi:DUF4159 domain-containing protein [candidate division KSB1 bacterium]